MGDATWEPLEVRVLGPFGVWVGGQRIDLASGRLPVLLAVLAMAAGQPVSVEWLTEAIWEEDPPANARRALQTYVTRLRNALGSESIATESGGYALRTTPDNVDALRFLHLLDRATTEPDVERALLAEAFELWRGAPFEGLDSRWLRESEAARLQERWLVATERRIDLDLADGRASEVVPVLRELASRHRLREPLWARLLIALARSGQGAEALEQYEVIRSRISDELGVDPGGELQQIHSDLLTGAVPAASPAPDARQEASVVPRQLPADIGGFSGRMSALTTLDELLTPSTDTGSPRVVVVHGIGGVGKTTLAVHWAHRTAGSFPDGQLYVNLRGYGPAEPVTVGSALDMLLRGLGAASDQIPTDVEARANLLRSLLTDRRILLLLDNARSADQVRPLLPGAGSSRVIVTSRRQLRGLVAREGAQRIAVDILEPSESVALLATVLAQRGVAFDAESLTELARLCGQLPLALAIAAERASGGVETGPAEIVEEIREHQARLDALGLGDDAADLRAVFSWSYRALDANTARLFRLLGLHPAHDTGLPAAAALSGTTPAKVRPLLDRLVDANLLQQHRAGRYELHDLLRMYAAELCDRTDPADVRTAAQDRLFGWYLHSTANGRKALTPRQPLTDIGEPAHDVDPLSFEEHDHAWTWFETERDTLLAVADALARLGRHRTTYYLVSMAWHYFHRSRALDDLLRLGWAAQEAARAMGDEVAEADCADLLGVVHGERTEHEAAVAQFEHALERFGRQGDSRMHARALSNLGVVKQSQRRTDEAISCYERSIAMARRIEAPAQELSAMNNLAAVYVDLRRYDDAARLAEAASELSSRRGDTVTEASVLDTLGQAQAGQGRHVDACASYRRSIQLFDEQQDLWGKGYALANLGRSLWASGEAGLAREALQQALDILDATGSPDGHGFRRADLVELLAATDAGRTG